MSSKNGKEKRLFHRYEIDKETNKEIEFYPLGQTAMAGKKHRGTTINRSDGGLCFSLDTPLEPWQVLKISIPFSNQTDRRTTAPTLGEVRWVQGRGLGKGYRVGVKYLL